MKRQTKFCLLWAMLCLTTGSAYGLPSQSPLVVGILPYLSPAALLKTWKPFIEYLEEHTERPVKVASAPDFRTYVKRAATGYYDVYQTAPHFALLAEKKYHYRRLARLKRELDGAIVVSRQSKAVSLNDLRGRIFATPDKLAIVTLLAELTLSAHGLTPHRDVQMKYTPSHNNALIAVIEGTADAAVTSTAVFERMSEERKRQLRLLTRTSKVPHMMIMAGPAVSESEYQALLGIILGFTAKGPGKAFFEESGYGDMVRIRDRDMARLMPILSMLNARLAK